MLPQHIFFFSGLGSKSLPLIMSFHHSLALNSEVMDAFQVDHVHPLGWEHFPDMPKIWRTLAGGKDKLLAVSGQE